MKVSVLIPVYNEAKTVIDVLDLVKNAAFDKEIILVDDGSADKTRNILKERFGNGDENLKILYHRHNMGKGRAVRTALSHATGDYIVIQDADMEYSPASIVKLAACVRDTGAEAVYGSRFLKTRKSTSFPHFLVNWFLTFLTNILFRCSLTDMETCYKMVRTDIMRDLDIRAEGFEIEPEITAKLLKKGYAIREMPIIYRGRGYDEGKKIGWFDGMKAVWVLFRCRFSG